MSPGEVLLQGLFTISLHKIFISVADFVVVGQLVLEIVQLRSSGALKWKVQASAALQLPTYFDPYYF